MNKVILFGRMGKDPELKYTTSGKPYAKMSLATSERWTKDGEKHEKTDWHNLVAWDKQAEIMAQYLKKGALVLVTGKISTRSWEKDGKKNYITEITVDSFEFTGKSSETNPEASTNDVPF